LDCVGDLVAEDRIDAARATLCMAIAIHDEIYLDPAEASQ
jgi:hypothetical protein